MLKKFCFVLILTLAPPAFAGGYEGVEFEGALGRPALRITNPDNTVSGYEGVSLLGRVFVPLRRDDFSIYLHGALHYEDLENTANTDEFMEIAKHKGLGFGAKFSYLVFYAGYEQLFMKAQHYLVGPTSNYIEYDYTASHIFAGLQYKVGQVRFGLGYGYTTGNIGKDEVMLSRDAGIEQQTFWFHVTYSTNISVTKMATSIARD